MLAMSWERELAARIARDVDLSTLVTVRIGGVARRLVAPTRDDEVGHLLAALSAEGEAWRVLGGGSNILPPDEVVDDVIIHPVGLDTFDVDGDRVHVGAGLRTSRFVNLCSQAGLQGIHVLAGVPGQVGGALAMNAGTRHGEICETVAEVHVRLSDGAAASLSAEDLSFGYRRAVLPSGAVITGATFRLRPVEDRTELRRTVGRYLKEKNAAQPTKTWNFGCMFKNPAEATAGRLLDRAGAKGLERGGARISPVHANFVENLGAATAADVRWLLEEGARRVLETTGIRLEREVRVWERG